MGHTFVCLHFHLVWGTRRREAVLDPALRERLFAYVQGIVAGEGGKLLKAGGTADHLHLLIEIRADMAVATLVRKIKSNTSKWIHETFPEMRAFAWQEGYGAFSVSRSSVMNVLEYVRRQEEHHRKRSFQEEFVEMLRKHEIPFDARYIWD